MAQRNVTEITGSGFASSAAEKAAVSRAVGRNRYVVFGAGGAIYSTTSRMFTHAIEDAKACGGEVWTAGRCTIPAHNIR